MLHLLTDAAAVAEGSGLTSFRPIILREVSTQSGCYRIRACLYGSAQGPQRSFILSGLESLSPRALSEGALRDRFGLTPSEARVGLLLGRGKSNIEIARELFISPHTAKRHTEHVLQKLGVRSRAEVAATIMTAA
jgi:DNA-binding CsgD family transcriptional regulator